MSDVNPVPAKTLFVSVYRPVSYRYLVYSGVVGKLLDQGFRVVLFVKGDDVDYYQSRLDREGVVFESVHDKEAMGVLKGNPLQRLLVLVRKCVSGSRGEIRNSTDAVHMAMYEKESSGTLAGRLQFGVARALIALARRSARFRRALVALEAALFPGPWYDHLFRKYQPSLLVVSSLGYMIDPYFMRAARRAGCPVASVIHSWDNPTTKDYRGHEPDAVVTWGEVMKREVAIFHDIPEERIHVGGIAHWDLYFDGSLQGSTRERYCAERGLSPERKLVVYGTSSPVMFRHTFDVIGLLLERFTAPDFPFPVQLLVRPHPGYLTRGKAAGQSRVLDDYAQRMQALSDRFPGLVSFDIPRMNRLPSQDVDMPIEDMRSLAETLRHSDVLLTEYSTLAIEAAVMDLPVLNVGLFSYRDMDEDVSVVERFTHLQRILATGACPSVHTLDALVERIQAYLGDRALDREARAKLVAQEVTTHPGVATAAIARLLGDLAEGRRPSAAGVQAR